MEAKIPIKELISKVLAELKRLNYTNSSLKRFRAIYNKVNAFAEKKKEPYFSEEFGKEFLKEIYNCSINYYTENMPEKLKDPIRKIRVLGDYQLHGLVIRRIVKKQGYIKPPQVEKELNNYENECKKNKYSKIGLRGRMQRLFFFIDYLDARSIQNVKEITAEIISDYVKTIYSHHEKSMSLILSTLRVFLRFLFQNQYIEEDLSLKVPKQRKYYYPPIPSLWNKEDVVRMLENIDRGNPTGKRDYAILLLAARLGMRVSDIKSLKLNELDWKSKTIMIKQNKTKNVVTYPILKDIGWALIDYLRNARPKSDSPFVFLRKNAPYEEFGDNSGLHHIITKHRLKAGITLPSGKHRSGLHSLRHTLASTLLEQGAPIPVISEILGHINSRSTEVYLKIGIEGLKQCALDPEEVFKNVSK